MRLLTHRRFWMALAYRLVVLGAGLAYMVAALEIPLPVLVHKDRSQPFPCQDHPCGCRTAEQCWSHCCCFTPEERWAWAKAHNIEPPAYAEKPAEKPAARGWNRIKLRDRAQTTPSGKSCCQANTGQAHCCQQTGDPSAKTFSRSRRQGAVTIMTVWRCHGYSTVWISAGAVLPVATVAAWSPDWHPPKPVTILGVKAVCVPSVPLDPPPRMPRV